MATTLDPSNKGTNVTLSNGNFSVVIAGSGVVRSATSKSSGKWYFEVKIDVGYSGVTNFVVGVCNSLSDLNGNLIDANARGYWGWDGGKWESGSESIYGASFTTGDVIGVAVDTDDGVLTFYKNNVSQGVAFTDVASLGTIYAAIGHGSSPTADECTVAFLPTTQAYSPPSGYLAWDEGVTLAGIPSPGQIGAPHIGSSLAVIPTGIPTPGAVGAPALKSSISPAGIPASAAVGAPRLGMALQVPAGIASPSVAGAPTITQGTTTILPTGYSGNLLTNPSAETGDLTGWSATGVTVAAGAFEFAAAASMSQSIGSQASPTIFLLTADWLPAVAYTPASVQMDAYLQVVITYSDGSQDTFTVPAQSYNMAGSWYNISSTITADDTKTVGSVTMSAITAGRAGEFDNLSIEKQVSGDVQLGVDYGGTTISPITGLTQLAANAAVISDQYGLNPNFVTCYPNKCANSSFENFDPQTLLPAYWDTNGSVSDAAAYVGDYSLHLAPGDYAVQTGTLLADPGWWSWCQRGTRIAFQAKGTGQIKVTVLQGGQPVPLSYMVGGEMVKVPAPYGWTVGCSPDWACTDSTGTLTTALRTCNVAASATGGPIAIRIDNLGDTDAYIDAVQIGPDWTGEWPGVYVDGPESEPNEVELVPQLFSAPYSASGVQFTLQTPVSQVFCSPSVMAADASAFAASTFSLICQPIRGTYQGQSAIVGVWVYPEGPSVPTTAAGTSAGAVITLITFGKPVSLVHWYALHYDDSWWQQSLGICTAGNPPLFDGANLWATPVGWVDGGAWWMWGILPSNSVSPEGDNYFRKTFVLSAATECTIDIACDDAFVLYVDEAPMLAATREQLLGPSMAGGYGIGLNPLTYQSESVHTYSIFVPGITIPNRNGGDVGAVLTGITLKPGTIVSISEADYGWKLNDPSHDGGLALQSGQGGYGAMVSLLIDYDGLVYMGNVYAYSPEGVCWEAVAGTVADYPSLWLDAGLGSETDPTPGNHTYTVSVYSPTIAKSSITMLLAVGEHILAIKGTNLVSGPPNPAGLLVTARNGSGRVIVDSDTSWKCLPYPNPALA